MNAFNADPARTYAVVVGVERYGIPGVDLDGPVRDACRFVRWLRARGIPAENIQLFASPLERNVDELTKLGVPWQPAGREPIHNCFTQTLPGTRGDLLFLFWGGHGLLTAGERRLIYADATEVATLNLDLHSLLNSLHGDLFAGLPRQVAIIDACANHVETLRDPEVFPCQRYEAGCEQFVLYGARPGEVAKNDGTLRSGIFSSTVLDELERQAAQTLPPDLPMLADQLGVRFRELRESGRTDQTPVFYGSQDWGGNPRQFGQIPQPAEHRKSRAKPMINIDDEIRAVLRPLMGDRDSRRARITRAFAENTGLLDHINVDLAPAVFLDLLINTLREYGEVEEGSPAVCVLLEAVRAEVGASQRARIDQILRVVRESGWGTTPANPH